MTAAVRVVALGPGAVEAVPAAALAALAIAPLVLAPPLARDLEAALGVAAGPLPDLDDLPPGSLVIAAPDAAAHAIARALPDAATLPDRPALRARAIGAEVAALAEVGHHLRRECPWDREQTAASIVPHTIEEAFEVAEAVAAGDPAHLADELGDLLFQSVFLAQLLEEDGRADLAAVARGQADKLVSRHPHVYGAAIEPGRRASLVAGRSTGRARAEEVVQEWERRKREERAGQGIFHDLPAGLPALAYATKAAKRAAAAGVHPPNAAGALAALLARVDALAADPGERALGDVLLAVVVLARAEEIEPELALRAAARRFRARVEASVSEDAG